MKTIFVLVLLAFSAASFAVVNEKYVYNSSKDVVMNSSKECVQDGYHTEDYTKVEACGDLVAPPIEIVEEIIRETVTVSVDAETLFGFDRADLTLAGESTLNNLIAELNNFNRVYRVDVIGHTDRLGSESYNQKLSEERAATVGTYLSNNSSFGSIIYTMGKGELEPIVACDDVRGHNALISCLQPNRRVEIVVDAEEVIERVVQVEMVR